MDNLKKNQLLLFLIAVILDAIKMAVNSYNPGFPEIDKIFSKPIFSYKFWLANIISLPLISKESASFFHQWKFHFVIGLYFSF